MELSLAPMITFIKERWNETVGIYLQASSMHIPGITEIYNKTLFRRAGPRGKD
jgi:hypothetical protein